MQAQLRDLLIQRFRWIGEYAFTEDWWRDPGILGELGPALSALHPDAHPTVVLATECSAYIPAALTALHLGVGVLRVTKDWPNDRMAAEFRVRTTPPDYNDRNLALKLPRRALTERDRVLFVDDWIVTGAQASVAETLVTDSGAEWLGAAVIVDDCEWAVRRRLNVRGILHIRDIQD